MGYNLHATIDVRRVKFLGVFSYRSSSCRTARTPSAPKCSRRFRPSRFVQRPKARHGCKERNWRREYARVTCQWLVTTFRMKASFFFFERKGLVLVGELGRHDAERGVVAAVRRLDAPVQIDPPVDEPGHGPVRRRRPVRVLHPPVEDVVDEVEQELDGGAKRGQRAGEREEEGLQEEVEEDGEPAAEAADLGAGEAVDGPVPADLGRAEEVQELHRAGPVRPQHHVVIAEAVVELAHAGRRSSSTGHYKHWL